jgi:Tol biopolymer transport system component
MTALAHRLAVYVVTGARSLVFLGTAVSAYGAPNGRIAYTKKGHIWVKNLDTGSNVDTGASGVNPKFSPNGLLITYNGNGVWVMNANGSDRVLLDAGNGGSPSFSPDGQKIAFSKNGIWVINLDGSGLTQLTNHGMKAAWAPDGSQIAFSSFKDAPDSEIWLMNADGTNAHLALTRLGEDIDTIWRPSWQIAFAGVIDRDYEIFSFDPNTSTLTRLTTRSKSDFEPAWSPDGTRIAFASPGARPAGIYVMNADGSSPQLVIEGGRQPGWGP